MSVTSVLLLLAVLYVCERRQVYMGTCVYVYAHIQIYVYMHTRVYVYISMCVYMCTHLCLHAVCVLITLQFSHQQPGIMIGWPHPIVGSLQFHPS